MRLRLFWVYSPRASLNIVVHHAVALPRAHSTGAAGTGAYLNAHKVLLRDLLSRRVQGGRWLCKSLSPKLTIDDSLINKRRSPPQLNRFPKQLAQPEGPALHVVRSSD